VSTVYKIILVNSSVVTTLAEAAPAHLGELKWLVPPYAPSGLYWLAIIDLAAGKVVVGDPEHNLKLTQAPCSSHNQCKHVGYCDRTGLCYPCHFCIGWADSIDSSCPADCGAASTRFELHDFQPNVSEVTASGAAPLCSRPEDLVVPTNTFISFGSGAHAAPSQHMSVKMRDRLDILVDLIQESPTMRYNAVSSLEVLLGHDPTLPTGSPEVTLHNAGRAADIAVRANGTNVEAALAQQDVLSSLATLSVQAGFDYVEFESENHVHVSVKPDACSAALDLVFLVDGSGSIESEWSGGTKGAFNDKVLSFVQEMVKYFTIGSNATRVGVVTFSTDVVVNFKLNDLVTREEVLAATKAISYPRGNTYTSLGINAVRTKLFVEEAGMRPIASGVSRVLIMLTDGKANLGYEPYVEAEKLRNNGVNLFVIGVGDGIQRDELEGVASEPTDQHIHTLRSMNYALRSP
jgi:hypothetical protein